MLAILAGVLLAVLLTSLFLSGFHCLALCDTDVSEFTLLGGVPGLLEVLLLLCERVLLARDDPAVLVVHQILLGQPTACAILVAVHNLGAGTAGITSLAVLCHLIRL